MRIGHVPLPPYINRDGSPGGPRALSDGLRARRAARLPRRRRACTSPTRCSTSWPRAASSGRRSRCTSDTARSSRCAPRRVEEHAVDPEAFDVMPRGGRRALTAARRERRRVIAVGTTTTRALESLAISAAGDVHARPRRDRLFIHPATVSRRRRPDHQLPPAALVAADAGVRVRRPRARPARVYRRRWRSGYRFYSYGDAMLMV